MDVTLKNEDACCRRGRNAADKENKESRRENNEFSQTYRINILRFVRKLLISCFVADKRGVDKSTEYPSVGLARLMKAIDTVRRQLGSEKRNVETIRRQLSSEKVNKRSDTRKKSNTMETPEVDDEWVNLVLQFLQSKELKSAMELCADVEEEKIGSDSSENSYIRRLEKLSRSSSYKSQREQNVPHKITKRKAEKTDAYILGQSEEHTSSSTIKKMKMFDTKSSPRRAPVVRTKETQTHVRMKNTSSSKGPSSDEFDVHPNDRVESVEIIYGPNQNHKGCCTIQSTSSNSDSIDNNSRSFSAPENVVSDSPRSDLRTPLYVTYPYFMTQRNMSTQTEESLSQGKVFSGVSGIRTDWMQYPTYKYASKKSACGRNSKHYSEQDGMFPIKIRRNEEPIAVHAKPKILSQKYPTYNQQIENNTLEINSKNSANKPMRHETGTQSSRRSCFTAGKNTIHYKTSIPQTEDERIPGDTMKVEVPTEENDLDLPLQQILRSQDSQRHISISLEVFGNDVVQDGKTNRSPSNSISDRKEICASATVPSNKSRDGVQKVQIFPFANMASQERSRENPPGPEKPNRTPAQSKMASSSRKRKYRDTSLSRSPPAAGPPPTPICKVTIHHRPTPFSCHSSKTDQSASLTERVRSPTPPADDCETMTRKSRSRLKKSTEVRDNKKLQGFTPLPKRVEERNDRRIGSGDKNIEQEEEQSFHTEPVEGTTNTYIDLKKSRSIALSPVNFAERKNKKGNIFEGISICDYMLNHGIRNKSLNKSLEISKDQKPDKSGEASGPKRVSNRYSQMAINLLICQKDFFKSHLQRLSNICDVLSAENQSPRSSASSESGDRRRCKKRRKKTRRDQHEILCREVLERYFPPLPRRGAQEASDCDEDKPALLFLEDEEDGGSKSSSSTSMILGGPLWWEATHSLAACRNTPARKRPHVQGSSRSTKGDGPKGDKAQAQYKAWSMWSNRARKIAKLQ